MRVVGIIKSVDSEQNWAPSAGFYAKYGHRIAGVTNQFIQLRGGEADLPRLRADMQRIVGHEVNVESFDDLFGIPKIRTIMRVEESGLLLFALAVLIVGGVLVSQALARAVTARCGRRRDVARDRCRPRHGGTSPDDARVPRRRRRDPDGRRPS